MIQCLLKGMMASAAIKLLTNGRDLSIRLLEIEATKSYLHGVQWARALALGSVRIKFMAGLIGFGALLMHAGLFLLLPWSVEAKALLGIGLGLLYVVGGCVLLRATLAEKTWIEKSGAAKMLKDVTGVKSSPHTPPRGFEVGR